MQTESQVLLALENILWFFLFGANEIDRLFQAVNYLAFLLPPGYNIEHNNQLTRTSNCQTLFREDGRNRWKSIQVKTAKTPCELDPEQTVSH